ncbi:MAG: PAS domain-containing [Bacteroidetes bacterium]|nr:MAG: PAS domain-containing [Bacteroidota bacterium]
MKSGPHTLTVDLTESMAVLDQNPMPIILVEEKEQIIVFANKGTLALTGFSRNELTGRLIDELIDSEIIKKNEDDHLNRTSGIIGGLAEISIKNKNRSQQRLQIQPIQISSARFLQLTLIPLTTEPNALAESNSVLAERLASIVNTQPEIIFRFLPDTTLTFVNDSYCRTFNLSKSEAIGRKFLDFVQKQERDRIKNHINQILRNPKPVIYEYLETFPDGKQVWWEWSDFPILNAEGIVTEIQTSGKEITDRKLTEEMLIKSEQEKTAFLASIPDIIFWLDRNGKYLKTASKDKSLLIKPEAEFIGRNITDILPEKHGRQAIEMLNMAFESRKLVTYEYEIQTDEGLKAFENRIIAFTDNEAVSIVRDITGKCKTEEFLKWNITLLSAISGASPLAYYVTDKDGDEVLYHNSRFIELWKLESHESDLQNGKLRNRDITEFCLNSIQNREKYTDLYNDTRSLNYAEKTEGQIKLNDNRIIKRFTTPLGDDSGHIIGRLYTFEDITESINSRDALAESELRWKFAIHGNGDGLWDWNVKTGEVYFSDNWKSMLGFKPEELKNNLDTWESRVHPEEIDWVTEKIQEYFDGKTPNYETEHRVKCKDGKYKWILDRGIALEYDADGKPIRLIGTHHDITGKKVAEEEIRRKNKTLDANNRFLNDILGMIPLRLFWKDKNLKYTGCNKLFALDAGLSETEEIIGQSDNDLVWKDHAELYQNDDKKVIETGVSLLGYEEQQTNPKGEIIWLKTYKIPIHDEHGLVTGIFGAYDDITQRKLDEENIKRNEHFLSELLKLSSELFSLNNSNELLEKLRVRLPLLFNADNCYITAWDEKQEETIPLASSGNCNEYIASASLPSEKTLTGSLMSSGKVIPVEDVFNSEWLSNDIAAGFPDKSLLGIPVISGSKKIGALLVGFNIARHFTPIEIRQTCLAKDMFSLIIARNQYLNDLNESEKLMRSFIENAPIGILAANSQGKYVIGNHASADLFGYTLDELLKLEIKDVLHSDSIEAGLNHFNKLMQTGTAITDVKLLRKDGSDFWGKVLGVKLSDNLLLSFHIDITDMVKSKEALDAEKNFLSTLLDSIPEIIFFKDSNRKYLRINNEFTRITGLSLNDVQGKTDHQLFDPERADYFKSEDDQIVVSGKQIRIHDSIIDTEGRKLILETLKAPYFDLNEKLIGILGVSRDITEKHKFQELLKGNEAWMRALLNSMMDMIFVIDKEDRFVESYNSMKKEGIFARPDDIIGKNFNEILPFEVSKKLSDALNEIRQGSYMQSISYSLPIEGLTRWYTAIISPVYIDSETIDSYIAVTRDVTTETNAKLQLTAERQLFLEGPTVIFKWDVGDGWPVNYVSPNILDLLGYPPSDFTSGKISFGSLVHPDEAESISEATLYNIRFNSNYFHQEYRLLKKDGTYIAVSDHSTIFRNSSGEAESILGYIQDISDYKELEDSLVYRAALQQILMTTAAGFINVPLHEIDHAINEALSEVGLFVGADRSYIFKYDLINGITSNTHEWCNQGIEPEIDNLKEIPVEAVEDWLKIHLAGKVMLIDNIADLEQGNLREILEPQGIKSLIAVPMIHGNDLKGFIGFDAVKEQKKWSDTDKELLRFMAELFTNAIVRIEYEAQITESEEKFKSIYENSTIGLYRSTPAGKILMVNPALVKMLGYENENELLKIDLYISPNVFESERQKFLNKIGNAGFINGFETIWKKRDGQPIYVRESAKSFIDDAGNISYFIGSVEDISERRNAEMALLESEEKFRQLAENVDSIFWIIDSPTGEILYVNTAFESFFGKTGDLIMKNFSLISDYIHPDDISRIRKSYQAYLKGAILDIEARFYADQNEYRWFRLRSFAIKNEEDITIRHAGIATDITAMKIAEQSLIESLEAEKHLSELKSGFVSMTSHEFRTPLATILASAETIQTYRHRMTDEQIDQRIIKITEQVQHMKILMEDMLELSRLESKKTGFDPKPDNLSDLIVEIAAEFNSYATDYKSVEIQLSKNLPVFSFDKKIMRQVITNLISNAIKYSPAKASAKVSLSSEGKFIVLTVKDEGIGIPPEALKNLYDPFFRAGNVGKIAGTGLGMPIVKQGIMIHNATIEVQSEVNKGTTFICKFES